MRTWAIRAALAVVAALFAYGLIVAVAYVFRRDLIYQHDPARVDPAAAGLGDHYQEKILTAADGSKLVAWVAPGQVRRPVVLYFMGNAGGLADRWQRLLKFAQQGYGVIALSWRGAGGSEGSPSEEALAADAVSVYDAMGTLLGQSPQPWRVVAYGESLGTGPVVRLALERRLGGVILEAPYTSLQDVARARFTYLPTALLEERYDILGRIPAMRAPMLVIYGMKDEVIPPVQSAMVFAAAKEPKREFRIDQGAHHDLWSYGAGEASIGFIEYFARFR